LADLRRQLKYRQRDVQMALDRIEAFDRSKDNWRLAWMLRELLKQRRRMRRNITVKQLQFQFAAP
jgi:hypothetical protein